jgi:alkylation response protein AidB-like acyl-CoA dehydrogenase
MSGGTGSLAAANRSLDNALHVEARVHFLQPHSRSRPARQRIAKAKTPAEAMRSLKRQLAQDRLSVGGPDDESGADNVPKRIVHPGRSSEAGALVHECRSAGCSVQRVARGR